MDRISWQSQLKLNAELHTFCILDMKKPRKLLLLLFVIFLSKQQKTWTTVS